jgi:hypothetical protein
MHLQQQQQQQQQRGMMAAARVAVAVGHIPPVSSCAPRLVAMSQQWAHKGGVQPAAAAAGQQAAGHPLPRQPGFQAPLLLYRAAPSSPLPSPLQRNRLRRWGLTCSLPWALVGATAAAGRLWGVPWRCRHRPSRVCGIFLGWQLFGAPLGPRAVAALMWQHLHPCRTTCRCPLWQTCWTRLCWVAVLL